MAQVRAADLSGRTKSKPVLLPMLGPASAGNEEFAGIPRPRTWRGANVERR